MIDKIFAKESFYLPSLIIFTLLVIPFVRSSYNNSQRGLYADFPSFYFAAENVFIKEKSPYDISAMKENETAIGQKILPYLYPPPTILLFRPLIVFDYPASRRYAVIVNILLYIAVVILLVRFIAPEHANLQAFQIFVVVFLLSFRPVQVDFQHIQVNTFLLFLFTVMWISLRQTWMPSIVVPLALTLAIFLKTYPVLFLLPLFLNRRYQLAWTTVLLCCLVVVASLCVLPFEYWIEWFTSVVPTGGYGRGVYANEPLTIIYNLSINGLVYRSFSDTAYSTALLHVPILARSIPYLVFIGVIFLAIRFRPQALSVSSWDREFCIYLLVIFLLAPISWEDHLTFLLPVFVVFAKRIFEKNFQVSFLEIILCFGLPLISWRLFYNFEYVGSAMLTVGVSAKTFILMLFFVYFLFLYAENRSSKIPIGE